MYMTTKIQKETNWKQIAQMAKDGQLKVGDEMDEVLKDGEPITFVVAHITEDQVHFISKDCQIGRAHV